MERTATAPVEVRMSDVDVVVAGAFCGAEVGEAGAAESMSISVEAIVGLNT